MEVKTDNLLPGEITEETVSQFLDTRGIPEPDLLIQNKWRTENFKFSALATGIYGILFYPGSPGRLFPEKI